MAPFQKEPIRYSFCVLRWIREFSQVGNQDLGVSVMKEVHRVPSDSFGILSAGITVHQNKDCTLEFIV